PDAGIGLVTPIVAPSAKTMPRMNRSGLPEPASGLRRVGRLWELVEQVGPSGALRRLLAEPRQRERATVERFGLVALGGCSAQRRVELRERGACLPGAEQQVSERYVRQLGLRRARVASLQLA